MCLTQRFSILFYAYYYQVDTLLDTERKKTMPILLCLIYYPFAAYAVSEIPIIRMHRYPRNRFIFPPFHHMTRQSSIRSDASDT